VKAEMSERLDEELLRALRRAPNRRLGELADEVGLPRTNFGRPMTRLLRSPVARLVDEGLVEEERGRYRLSDRGRRRLAEDAYGGLA
jgi:DNA-binding IclR family transcriptional regulator